MKIATVTPVYNSPFLRPFLKQIEVFDENIILLGEQPFEDYLLAGLIAPDKGETEAVLAEFPKVHIVRHSIKFYSGELFNLGLDVAKRLGCDVIVKLDPDMFLTNKDMKTFLHHLQDTPDVLSLNMKTHTMVYETDFEHGVTQALWHVGGEPFIVKTTQRFAEDGTNIRVTGDEPLLDWPIMIHHLSGFKRNIIAQVEQMEKFPGWTPCPKEIQDRFQEE